jgi:single-strand DNA-binding protein
VHDTRITVIGNLAADPVRRELDSGTRVTNFRIGSTPRRRARDGSWGDGPTSWWEVSCYDFLADNTAESLRRGDRVVVTGRAWVDQWQVRDTGGAVEKSGTTARVTADAVGHDLAFGTSAFTRIVRAREVPPPDRDELAAELGGRVDAHGVLSDFEEGLAEAEPAMA